METLTLILVPEFSGCDEFTENCAEKRDAIKASGSIPAYTLACALGAANALLAHGWPGAKRLGSIPPDKFPIMLVSDGRCLTVMIENNFEWFHSYARKVHRRNPSSFVWPQGKESFPAGGCSGCRGDPLRQSPSSAAGDQTGLLAGVAVARYLDVLDVFRPPPERSIVDDTSKLYLFMAQVPGCAHPGT
jgi:hypothetical protein